MGDPVTTAAVFAFLNSAFKFAEYAVKLYSVDSENGVFVRMIQRVRLDLEETERLVYSPTVKSQLVATPGKLPWIRGVILSTKGTLNEIGRWVERVRSDKEGHGSISWENRVRWVFSDNEKLVNRRMELGTCHQTLSTVLAYLSPLEQAATSLVAGPPEYQDATFLDDLLSPRQRRRKARDLERREEGTSRETQKTQAQTSAISFPNLITHYKSSTEENIATVNDVTILQNPRHHFPPTLSTSEGLSFIAPVSSPTAFPMPNTKTSFTERVVEDWSPNHSNPHPATILSPASTSNILRKPSSSSVLYSPGNSTITGPSTTTSPVVLRAQASSAGYVGQAVLPASRPSPQSSQTAPSVGSVPEGELNQGKASQHCLNTLHNPLNSPSTSGAHSLSSTNRPTSAPQYCGSVRPLSPAVHSAATASCQSISLVFPNSSGHTLQAETQNFSATNTLGPIDIFELYPDPEPPATLRDCNQSSNVPLCSQQSGLETSQPTHLSLSPGGGHYTQATDLESAVTTESLPEMMADLAVQRPASQVSLVDMPNSLFVAQSQSEFSFEELSTRSAGEQTATSRIEMSPDTSTGHFSWPNSTAEVSAAKYNDRDELHFQRQRAISHASNLMNMSPPSDPEISQSPYQYDQSMAFWLNTQAQAPQTQPKYYAQDQYQAYCPPSAELTSRSVTSSVIPSPVASEQRSWTGPTYLWPPVEAPTPVQPATPMIEQRRPHSRSMTVGEARRRNQKIMLNLMGQGFMGDRENSLRSHR